MVLPKYGSRSTDHFIPASNSIAPDEVQGHTGMFGGNTNDGYYQLGLAAANIIRDAVLSSRGIIPNPPKGPWKSRETQSPRKEKANSGDLIKF